MKLYITDSGDPSVGIFSQVFVIDCPFDDSDRFAYLSYMQEFKTRILNIYKAFCDFTLSAEFDWERELEIEREKT